MRITDELRAWARDNTVQGEVLTTLPAQHPIRGTVESLLRIADRIDAEHEAKVSYWQGASYKDGYDEGFASADDWLAQHEDAMAEHGWVRLPKDADGEYIHIGDVMEIEGGKRFEVRFLTLRESEWTVNSEGWFIENLRHHHAPIVEDVLTEFAERYLDYESVPSAGRRGIGEALIDEYAAKLRLAGDAE